ncbi:MAG: FxsA family protein [Planctomycetota bacterium]
MPLLALLFVVVPLVELALLFQVGEVMGLGATIGLVLATGILGAALARHQGAAVLRQLSQAAQSGQDIGRTLAEGAMVLVAGVLLLTPGVLTDVVGLLLLVPPLRRQVAPWVVKRLLARGALRVGGFGASPFGQAPPFGQGAPPFGQPFTPPSEEVKDIPVEVRDVPED